MTKSRSMRKRKVSWEDRARKAGARKARDRRDRYALMEAIWDAR